MSLLTILRVETAEQLMQVRLLFKVYAATLDIDLSFQNFKEELAGLPGSYAPPTGCLILASYEGKAAGCVALRRLDKETCEMKRLYVLPIFRKMGIGVGLALAVIDEARKFGYRRICLDTLPYMIQARRLYKSLGFKEIKPYRFNPVEGALFMELILAKDTSL